MALKQEEYDALAEERRDRDRIASGRSEIEEIKASLKPYLDEGFFGIGISTGSTFTFWYR